MKHLVGRISATALAALTAVTLNTNTAAAGENDRYSQMAIHSLKQESQRGGEPVAFVVEAGEDVTALASAGLSLPFEPTKYNGRLFAPEASTQGELSILGDDDCGGLFQKPCGVVHNETSHYIEIIHRRGAGDVCLDDKTLWLAPNKSSSSDWKDTDCFGATVGKICYKFRCKGPGDYHKLYNHVWVWEVNF